MTRRARNITWTIIVLLLLSGAATLCVLRWNAWFVNPPEPPVDGSDTLEVFFHTFGQDSVPGFERMRGNWIETDENDTILRFMVLGDIHNSLDSADWAMLGTRHPDLDFYAQAGDFVERSYAYYFKQLAHQQYGTPFATLPVMSTPGNHEYQKGVVRRLPQQWSNYFPNPHNGPDRFKGTTYYVDFMGLRMIMIDTNGLQRISDYTIVNAWTKKVLREARNRYAIVVMHHPVFSSGKGRQNPLVYVTFRRALREADLVFSGHDHNYARRDKYIGTNAARKFYRQKEKNAFDKLLTDKQFYEVVSLAGNRLIVQSYELESGQLCDEIVLDTPAW